MDFELSAALPSHQEFVRALVIGCRLQGQVPAVHYMPNNVQLVVDSNFEKIWFDGVEVVDLKPDTQPFKFVELLVSAAPAQLDSRELSKQLSPGSDDGTRPARQAKAAVKKAIEQALAAQGKELGFDPFAGFRCRVSAVKEPPEC